MSSVMILVEKYFGELMPKPGITKPLSWEEVLDKLPGNLIFSLVFTLIIMFFENKKK